MGTLYVITTTILDNAVCIFGVVVIILDYSNVMVIA